MFSIKKLNRFLAWIYPLVLVFTGLAIFTGGISAIVVLTKFASFNPHWLYHLCVIPTTVAMFWWFWYFMYAGIRLMHRPTKELHPMTGFTQALHESISDKELL